MPGNLLSNETSPYLLQHKNNPVHWRAWNQETLDEAIRENKPILLSIGYSACHWCHVMAHESFEDEEVAAVMNKHFINIKVDREERPDIDTIYMSSLNYLGEQGGWPLTMFLTPKGEPFWGGTYFPKTSRFGRPGFIEVLEHVSFIFKNHRDKVEQNQAALVTQLKSHHAVPVAGQLTPDILTITAKNVFEISDPLNGGLNGAPKFPQTFMYELLWRIGTQTANESYKKASLFALERISMGGIYDHLGGGYARYSVDEKWLVPHFEKMLYDNALLIKLAAMIWPDARSEILRRRVAETIQWLEREMLTSEGGLASSLDADSEGVEGKFYVWTLDELKKALSSSDAALFAHHYDITKAGNWEGVSIANRLNNESLGDEKTEAELDRIRSLLLKTRSKRVRPGIDDKILCDWNGIAITAIARASFVFQQPEWLKLAEKIFRFVSESMKQGHFLYHSYRKGKPKNAGQLSDYANMIQAALALYERTLSPTYLDQAESWTNTLETHFMSENGFFYMVSDKETDLLVRPVSASDDATPNGNAVMVENMTRLGHLTGNSAFLDKAELIINAFADDIKKNPLAHAGILNAYHQSMSQIQISITSSKDTYKYIDEILHNFVSDSIVLIRHNKDSLPAENIFSKEVINNSTKNHFVCIGNACLPPANDILSFTERLRDAKISTSGKK